MLLTRSRENCTTCGTRIVSFCLLLVGWLLRTRVGHPSKARGERATHSMARRGGGTGRRSSRTHKALEHQGPRATSPRDKTKITSDFLKEKQDRPPRGDPHSRSTRGTEAVKGLPPDPSRRSARPLVRRGVYRRRRKKKKRKKKYAAAHSLQAEVRRRGTTPRPS